MLNDTGLVRHPNISKGITEQRYSVNCSIGGSFYKPCINDDGDSDASDGHFYLLPLTAVVVILIFILVIGFFGNVIVVIIVVKKRRMQTCTNWLIANLALCDLAVSIFCVPLDIPLILTERWIYGEFFCAVYYPVGTATMYGSVFTLVTLTYTRFWAIRYPFREQASVFAAKVVIGGIWVLSFLLVVPLMSVLRYDSHYQVCHEDWAEQSRAAYTICIFLLGYAIPLLVITVAYGFILYEIIFKKRPYMTQSDQLLKENKKLFKLALVITVTFVVCVSPNQLVWILFEFSDFENYKYITDVQVCSHLLLFLNSALNPIIYNVFSASFREGFKQLKSGIISKVGKARDVPIRRARGRTPTLCSELKVTYTLKSLLDNETLRESGVGVEQGDKV